MAIYILKSSMCLLAFMAFYKLFLERSSIHKFKRFYLLGVILISIGIPFITFTEYIEPHIVLDSFGTSIDTEISNSIEIKNNYLPMILWSIYGLGVVLFGLKFGYNLSQIISKIRTNPKKKINNFINVLLNDLIVPHTFFSYIFFNKTKFENKEIPNEVFLHEELHAKQQHSLDIIFIELLQIAFWFNPLVYLLKKDIKLNHEFLADQAVINKGVEPSNYQEILLAFSSNASEPQLANAINYSSIKKRFTVMKTQTSKKAIGLKSLVLLPLLAILIYGFSTTKQVSKDTVPKISTEDIVGSPSYSSTKHTARSIDIQVFNNGAYEIDGIKANKNTFVSVINQLHQDITPELRNKLMNIHLSSLKDISNNEVWFIYNSLLDYGFHRIVTTNQEIIREKGNKPFAINSNYTQDYSKPNLISNPQEKATAKQVEEYNTLAKHYNNLLSKKDFVIKLSDMNRLKAIYNIMSDKQKQNAEPFPNFPPPPPAPHSEKVEDVKRDLPPPPPPPIPENATPEQKVKYKKVVEGYHKKYTVKNGKVSHRLAPPPPPIPKNATPEQKKKYKEATAKYAAKKAEYAEKQKLRATAMKERVSKREYQMADRVKERESRLRTIKGKEEKHKAKLENSKSKLIKQEAKMVKREAAMKEREAIMVKRGVRSDIPKPPPPKSPLDHVIEMAKKDAAFYYEGKSITSDKAINLLKKNPSLNISSKGSNTKRPTVHLSKKGITIED